MKKAAEEKKKKEEKQKEETLKKQKQAELKLAEINAKRKQVEEAKMLKMVITYIHLFTIDSLSKKYFFFNSIIL